METDFQGKDYVVSSTWIVSENNETFYSQSKLCN